MSPKELHYVFSEEASSYPCVSRVVKFRPELDLGLRLAPDNRTEVRLVDADDAVGLAQTRERLLKLKQLVTVVLGVVFHVDSC